jgi:hypothetical protein
VLVGGAGHDILYGFGADITGNDRSTDYLYGDFSTNGNEAGSGNDRLFGQSGHDFLFGEGGDDFIDAAGASNWIDYGAGEGANPSDFVTPTPTPDAVPIVGNADPRATDTTPQGPVYRGWWGEIAGSADGSGVSASPAEAIEPAVASDSAGNRYVAWADSRNGNYEIYVAQQTASGWQALGGSAAGGGISLSAADSRYPALIVTADGAPMVAWTEVTDSGSDIFAARYDAASNRWVALGDSLSSAGLSQTGKADDVHLVETAQGPVVAWLDRSSGSTEVYVKTFDGTGWNELGVGSASGAGVSGITAHGNVADLGVGEFALATDGGKVTVAFSRYHGPQADIYAVEYTGGGWNVLGGAASSGGISDNRTDSRTPTVAYQDGQVFVAWRDQSNGFEQVYAKRFDGNDWIDTGIGSATGGGISGSARRIFSPQLASAGGQLYLAWVDYQATDFPDTSARLYAKVWQNNAFVEALPGDASLRGISPTGGYLNAVTLAVDSQGLPTVAWSDSTAGLPQIYLRTVTQTANRIFTVTPAQGIQSVLDANDLGAGDVLVLQSGNYAGFTLGADDAGVLIIGAPNYASAITGNVTLATGGVLQRLQLLAGATVAPDAVGLTLVDNQISGGGVTVNGGSDLQILHNRFDGSTGLTLAGAAQGLIAHNDIGASGKGVVINAAFSGEIRDNDIHGAATGVQYDAPAVLISNQIRDNNVGVRTTVAGSQGFGFLGASPLDGPGETRLQNDIYHNATGVVLVNASLQAQQIRANSTGVSGSGILGADDFVHANLIEGNVTGVSKFNGTIQYNRIAGNTTGIDAESQSRIVHNLVYRNTTVGVLVAAETDVYLQQNTFYSPVGDLLRIVNGASNVEVRGNVFWAEGGCDIYVANDSQNGFFSDYNNLYTSNAGKVGYWTKDFTDVLDWQADIARFDLHSIGATAVNPDWAKPQFLNLRNDDYRLFDVVAQQRFTSPSVNASDAKVDLARDEPGVNLLSNAGFENGLSGWNANPGAGVRTATPDAFDGTRYFTPNGATEGFAEQYVDLTQTYSSAQLDGEGLHLVFGGRVRQTPIGDVLGSGKFVIRFVDAGNNLVRQVETPAVPWLNGWVVLAN